MFRRVLFVLVALLLVAGLAAQQKAPSPKLYRAPDLSGIPSGRTRVLDLSYAINDKLTPWPGDTKTFEAQVNATVEKNGYFTRSFWMLEHFGTHMDAPLHFPPGKTSVDQIPPERLFGPAVVIDVRAAAEKNPDYRLTPQDVADWERRHGRIPAGAIVVLRTGWAARFWDAARYRNMDAQGVMHFPGFSVEAVKLLIRSEERRVGKECRL